jgi:hypothetical protein
MAVILDELDLERCDHAPRVPQPLTPVPVSVFSDAAMADMWVRSRLAGAAGREVLKEYVR